MLSFLVMFGILVIVPYYLERGYGIGPARAGIELMAMPLALGVVAPLAGRVADRVGVGVPTVVGMALVALGLVGMGVLHPATPGFLGLLAEIGAGLGLFMSPNNAGIMAAVPAAQSGLASGVLNMSRGIGTALGLAATGALFGHFGGDGPVASTVRHAFSVTTLVLAAVAALAGLIAWSGAGVDRGTVQAPAGSKGADGATGDQ